MRRVCVVITARPSFARVQTALEAMLVNPGIELQVVVSGSALLWRFGSAVDQIRRRFPVVAELPTVIEGDHPTAMGATTGYALLQLAPTLAALKPDVVVTIADRYETLATAIAAAYQNIPLAHVQGGEVTGSIDEKVRHSITKLADLHFTSTEKARERVIIMGESPATVWNTGCPSIDLAAHVKATHTHPFIPYEKYGGVGPKFDTSAGYYVVLQHPVTTHPEKSRAEMLETLSAVRRMGMPAFVFWPNVDHGSEAMAKALREWREFDGEQWHFYRHMEPDDFLRLLLGAEALIGNSSVGIRECSFLGVPVCNIGDRQAGRERGPNVVDAGNRQGDIEAALAQLTDNGRPPSVPLYGDGTAGIQIAAHLASAKLSFEKRLLG